jgi:plasmid stabilization system protein ParE
MPAATDQPAPTTSATGDATGQADNGQQNGGNAGDTITLTKTQLQQQIDAVVKDRLEREQKKTDAATKQAREEAEAKALVEQQEWKKLAEKYAGRITELEAKAAEVEAASTERDRYKAALGGYLENERKGLPDHILTLLDRFDPVAQLEYIAANRDTLRPAATTPAGGPPPSPKPGDPKIIKQQAGEAAIDQLRATGRYAPM